MAEEKKDNLITVTIDGQDLQVPPGTNMVEAVKLLGKEVPHYCYLIPVEELGSRPEGLHCRSLRSLDG